MADESPPSYEETPGSLASDQKGGSNAAAAAEGGGKSGSDAAPGGGGGGSSGSTTNNNSSSGGSSSNAPAPSGGPRGPSRIPFPLDIAALTSLRARRVVLASQSPRRRALLAQLGLPNVEVLPSSFAEDLPKTLSPFDYVLQTASAKCMDVYREVVGDESREEPALVLAADTVVVAGTTGTILEKPRSEAQHKTMLRSLRDSGAHTVVTSVVVMAPLKSARDPGYAIDSHTEETRVVFGRDTSDEEIDAYVRTREGADKAGGYGIQGTGAFLVERIEGNFENVVGLPLRGTLRLIQKVFAKAEDEETLEGEDLTDQEDE